MRAATVDALEDSLAGVVRLLADRDTVGDIARRSGHDLAPASWALLEHLAVRGAMRVSAIAACHGVDVSSVTPRLKALESAGLVVRDTLPADARVSLISISETGRDALQSVHAARREILTQALEQVDPGDVTAAARVLTHIADRLSTIDQRLSALDQDRRRPRHDDKAPGEHA